ncbi:CPBP family glutamic-type intramembrane protease [Nesterenkonia sp. PF2B19]
MGVVFGAVYLRYGRVMPLVIAHFLLDAVAFLAFPLVLRLTGVSALIGG